jgi:hypothetical protein
MASITSLPSGVSGSSLVLISTVTASSSATIEFTSGIDSTYKEYIFKFIDIHPATDQKDFTFNLSADTGSNYNVTKTSSMFGATHTEDDATTNLFYDTNGDLAQSTSFQPIHRDIGNGNDESLAGTLHLFDPSSTTFVKHYIASLHGYQFSNQAIILNTAGYGNTTSAVDAVQFKFSSGNIDSGTIKMYGVV